MMGKEHEKTLDNVYTKSELSNFAKVKKNLPKEVHIYDSEDEIHKDLSVLNPKYIYDKQHDMLYHRVSEGCYKHVA